MGPLHDVLCTCSFKAEPRPTAAAPGLAALDPFPLLMSTMHDLVATHAVAVVVVVGDCFGGLIDAPIRKKSSATFVADGGRCDLLLVGGVYLSWDGFHPDWASDLVARSYVTCWA